MKARDVIKALKKHDPNMDVVVPSWNEEKGKARLVEDILIRFSNDENILYGYSRLDISQKKPLREVVMICGKEQDHS